MMIETDDDIEGKLKYLNNNSFWNFSCIYYFILTPKIYLGKNVYTMLGAKNNHDKF